MIGKMLRKMFGKKAMEEVPAGMPEEAPVGMPAETPAAVPGEEKEKTVQDWCGEFADAQARKDPEAMKEALMGAYNACGSKDSMCLNELFCPECPMGGLVVKCGRAGL